MARLRTDISLQLEQDEGALGCMASALALLDLMEVRMNLASLRQPAILTPALNDLQHVRRLIRRAQSITTLPSSRACEGRNAAE